jgi:hypothetical protein
MLNTNRLFEKLSRSYLFSHQVVTVHFVDQLRQNWLRHVQRVAESTSLKLQDYESCMICMAVHGTSKLGGAIAEVGVFRGGSAKLICELKGDRPLHLFDTFEGLPELGQFDTSQEFRQGQFKDTSYDHVCKLMTPYPNVSIHRGYFPDTAGPVQNERFSLVHLDVDLHDTTKAALEFFYPRMVPGGIVISHDYVNADGVRKAFDDFFASKPEPLLVVSDTQCMVTKVGVCQARHAAQAPVLAVQAEKET